MTTQQELLPSGRARLYWESHGAGPETLLLTHGYSATSAMWRPQIQALRERVRVVVWDMRGHGRTETPDDPGEYSHARTVADMERLLDHVGAERAVVGGMSLGGFVSLAFHLQRPERVAGLVLVDTGPGYKSKASRAAWNRSAEDTARRFEGAGLEALPERPEVGIAHHPDARGLALAARGMLAQQDDRVIRSLPEVRVPTLLICGALDEPFLDGMAYMHRKIEGSRYVVVPEAGHAANLDQPAAVNAEIGTFLDQLS